ncbi:MAG: hypothetical protein JSW59_00935, partial [Phycisphaerales bacterium]
MHRWFGVALVALVTAVPSMNNTRAGIGGDGAGRGLIQTQVQRAMPLAINEFMASNRNFMQDPQGQFDDWIEIHNYGPDPID